jgi:hypothetical protein
MNFVMRTVDFPQDVRWIRPVISADALLAAASAGEIVGLAQREAARLLEEAKRQVVCVHQQARQDFLKQYGCQFDEALQSLVDVRNDLVVHIADYAKKITASVVQRLRVMLPQDQQLACILEQVTADVLPGGDYIIEVAPSVLDQAQAQFENLIKQGRFTGLSFKLIAVQALSEDEVALVSANGARLQCGFKDLFGRLIACIEGE